MKYRVERERTDNGFGPGWVVMNADGRVIAVDPSWAAVLAVAVLLAEIARDVRMTQSDWISELWETTP